MLLWVCSGDRGFIVLKYAQVPCLILFCSLFVVGCMSTPEAQSAPLPPRVDSSTIDASFEGVWQRTRDVLLAEKYEIYTRDKRGLFVAYTKVKRRLLFFPQRMKLTITLEAVSADETRVSIETIYQKYRVTPLTYPDWRDDSKIVDEEIAGALIEAIRAGEVLEREPV